MIQITDPQDPDYGKFVMTVTEGACSFSAYLSEDLVNWEPLGTVIEADDDTDTDKSKILYHNTWAPEMIYDEDLDKYYLFFNATPRNDPEVTGYANDSGSTTCSVFEKTYTHIPFIAVSDSFRGPFELVDSSDTYRYSDGTPMKDENGVEITKAAAEPVDHAEIQDNALGYSYFLKYSVFDPYQMWQAIENSTDPYVREMAELEPTKLMRSLDLHPFVDTNGDKYLYFTCGKDNNYSNSHQSFILGMKMNSWTDPDYSTITRLTRYGYYEVDDVEETGVETPAAENTNALVNEGPWMTVHNGKYYLTLSVNRYSTNSYKVVQAVSDSPLGPFRKLTDAEGGILLAADSIDDISGPGHNSIVEVNGETHIVYHKHDDPALGGNQRHVAVNKVEWVTVTDKFGDALDVMYTNGPTNSSVQPLPAFASGYANIAPQAQITATNISEASDAGCLNDGLIGVSNGVNSAFTNTYVKETEFTDETTITLTFEEYKTVRAVMIYNSPWIESAFYDIARIEVVFDDNGRERVRYIEDLAFDWESNSDQMLSMNPAGAAIAEFDAITVKQIRITVKPATAEQLPLHDSSLDAPLAISEIIVLGKQ